MMTTKQRFGKLDGNVAYHGYQSFNIGEVTPEEAHKIGMETAKRMWGKNFEVVVTTHLNTENLHNHFVVNSVSFRTGRKFENHISSGFEPVFLYMFEKQHNLSKTRNLKIAKQKLEQSKNRILEIDRVISKLYEDNALGKISDERFERISQVYEQEQNDLMMLVGIKENEIAQAEQEKVDLRVFLKSIRKCTDIQELTPEIVNTLIKRIDIHNPERIDGCKRVKVDITFVAAGIVSIPDENEVLDLIEEMKSNAKSA